MGALRHFARGCARFVAVGGLLTGIAVVDAVEPASAAGITHVRTVENTDVVSAGVSGVGSAGIGTITVAGVSGTVTQALLFWHGINPSNDASVYGSATPTIEGTPVVGISRGDAGNNCWGPGSSRTYVGDVTSVVTGNGAYDLTGLASTAGDNANGASLVVFYDDGNAANNRDFVLFEGNDADHGGYPGDGMGWDASLPGIDLPAGGAASLELHVADGQDFGQPDDGDIHVSGPGGMVTIADTAGRWDGTTLPSAGGSRAGNGQLFDIESFDITAALVTGANTVTIEQDPAADCLGLVLAMVGLPAGAAPPAPSSCSINDVSLAEGDAGTTNFTFTVSRTSGAGPATLDFTTSNVSATAGTDYTALSAPVSFIAGDLSESVTVQVTGDLDVEGDELFLGTLSNAVGCVLLDPNGFGTILNDDDLVTNQPPLAFSDNPSDGEKFYVGQVSGFVFHCTDPDGDVTTCTTLLDGTTPVNLLDPIPTATPGTHTVVITADDGQAQASASATFHVVATDAVCRATAIKLLGLSLGSANPALNPCQTKIGTLVNLSSVIGLSGPLAILNNTIKAEAVRAETSRLPGRIDSSASIAEVRVKVPLLGLDIFIHAVKAGVTYGLLDSCFEGSVPSTSVARIDVNGKMYVIGDKPVTIPLGPLGSIKANVNFFNPDGSRTAQSVVVDLPGTLLDITLSEATSGIHCKPVPPPAP